jgi:hypothetical protein
VSRSLWPVKKFRTQDPDALRELAEPTIGDEGKLERQVAQGFGY